MVIKVGIGGVLRELGKEQEFVHIGQVGIGERNPKRCRLVGENSCVVFVVRVGLESVVTEQTPNGFPRDAGLLEASTRMGLSLSLPMAAMTSLPN